MPTSGVDVLTRTARQVIKRAFVLINAVPATQDVREPDELYAVDVLNEMTQHWTTCGVTAWRKQSATFQPVQGQAEYTINERPLEVISLRWVQVGGTEIPLHEITHDEYFDLPNKETEGLPSQYYVRRDRTTTTVFLWPTPCQITTESVALTYNRRTQIVEPANVDTQEIDLPQEWLDTVTYCLAARLADSYGGDSQIVGRVTARSEQMFEMLKMYEREGDQHFLVDETYTLNAY